MYGVGSQIRTGGFTVLQTVALDHSAIPTLINKPNFIILVKRQDLH